MLSRVSWRAAGALPVTGYATLQVFDRSASLRRGVSTLIRLFTLRREQAMLRAERASSREISALPAHSAQMIFASPV